MRPYQPRIALIVDNPLRDLAGQVLLGLDLSRRGFNVFLVPLSNSRELWAIAPDAIIFTYARNNNAKLIQLAYRHGIKCIILETEGGIFLGGIETRYSLFNINKKVREHISLVCAWGEQYANFVLQKDLYPQSKVIITGHPRFDFYHSSLKGTLKKFEHFSTSTVLSEKMILVATNFPYVNPRYASSEQERRSLASFNFDADYIDLMMISQKKALDGFLKLINDLSTYFPSVSIVVRPHPFESSAIYQESFKSNTNVAVIQEGGIAYWLSYASALIHWRSSTAVEAMLMGVQSFIPNWLPSIEEDTLNLVSTKCEVMDDLIEGITNALNSPKDTIDSIKLHKIISQTFYKIDGLAHQRIANAIETIIGQPISSGVSGSLREVAYDGGGTSYYSKRMDWIRSLFSLPINFTSHTVSNLLNNNQTVAKTDKLFSKTEVIRIIDAIVIEQPHFQEVKVLSDTEYLYPFLNGKSVQMKRNK